MLKPGIRVDTEYGPGTVLHKDGFYPERYCVRLDNCPDRFIDLQIRSGGLYFWKNDLLTL